MNVIYGDTMQVSYGNKLVALNTKIDIETLTKDVNI